MELNRDFRVMYFSLRNGFGYDTCVSEQGLNQYLNIINSSEYAMTWMKTGEVISIVDNGHSVARKAAASFLLGNLEACKRLWEAELIKFVLEARKRRNENV